MNNKNKKGFSLVEILLYISILATVILVVSMFLATSLTARVKSQTILEVESQGTQILENMNRVISQATTINFPSVGSSQDSVSIDTLNTSKNPTIFNIF